MASSMHLSAVKRVFGNNDLRKYIVSFAGRPLLPSFEEVGEKAERIILDAFNEPDFWEWIGATQLFSVPLFSVGSMTLEFYTGYGFGEFRLALKVLTKQKNEIDGAEEEVAQYVYREWCYLWVEVAANGLLNVEEAKQVLMRDIARIWEIMQCIYYRGERGIVYATKFNAGIGFFREGYVFLFNNNGMVKVNWNYVKTRMPKMYDYVIENARDYLAVADLDFDKFRWVYQYLNKDAFEDVMEGFNFL
jgi:hypothetical protein